jgi:imidazole glycerol-phosphate synthase subunit HisH
MLRIAIFDYGAGNLYSLKAAVERVAGTQVSIINNMKNIHRYNGLILPGVGNFDPAIVSIGDDKESFTKAVSDKIPILGICLGMEMLFNRSEEGKLDGLGILDGEVLMLNRELTKIPHMGWNNLSLVRNGGRLLKGIPDGSWVYFVHSYRVSPHNMDLVIANSEYGITIPAALEIENLFGTQFHPEKSGKTGGTIIKNFLSICSENL